MDALKNRPDLLVQPLICPSVEMNSIVACKITVQTKSNIKQGFGPRSSNEYSKNRLT